MNYQILLKSRSDNARERYGSLKVIEQLHKRLGEQLLPLLPESVPFLAELMEDSDPRVEKLCREIVTQIETTLGTDALRQYF